MKNFSNLELKAIYDGLNNGLEYSLVTMEHGGYIHGRIYKSGDYIHYQVHGSSAVSNTVEDLKWLLTVLFKGFDDVTPSIYSYEIFNSVDLTGRYHSIDVSRYHDEIPETIYNGEFYYKIANGKA